MNKKIRLTIIAILLLNSWVFSQSQETKFQAVIDSVYQANPTSVGIMVHVESPDNGISWSGASGFPSKETNTKLEADQPVWIASNTKTYVSATILRLVEEGNLSIDEPINRLISDKSRELFEEADYDLSAITIKHLLSHTSGIQNYANQEYVDAITNNKKHRWTRDEQLELTTKMGPPLGEPGFTFNYSDANYLLCTEIIETIEKKPFYNAMRGLLSYEDLGLNNSWFPTLEEKPVQTKELAHQYWGQENLDNYDIDVSIDLYGGGGIACPTKDLARFAYNLFNEKIVKDTAVLNLIFTEVQTKDEAPSNYYLGVYVEEYHDLKAYGHGGFWGTVVLYFPELNSSIAIYILERDNRQLRKDIMDLLVGMLME